MKYRNYRGSHNIDYEIDVFDYKDDIIQSLSDKELQDELERRKEENDNVTKSKSSYYIDIYVDISNYYDDMLDYVDDNSLINELESRGKIVADENESIVFDGDLKKLAKFVGLREWSTKEQILNEINYFINGGK